MHEISLYERILNSNLINFIIMVSILVFICKKVRLGSLIQKLADDVQNNVELSAKHVQEALKEYKDAKRSTKNVGEIKENITKEAKINAQNLKEKIEAQTKFQEEEILLNLEKTKNNHQRKAQEKLTQQMYLACVDMAQKEIESLLDEDMHNHLIENSIAQIDNLGGIKL